MDIVKKKQRKSLKKACEKYQKLSEESVKIKCAREW